MYESVTHFLPQHTTIDERCAAAERLAAELRKHAPAAPPPIPLCVDTMANAASYAYGALPERLVVLHKGRVAFIGGKGPEDYSIDEARVALAAILGR